MLQDRTEGKCNGGENRQCVRHDSAYPLLADRLRPGLRSRVSTSNRIIAQGEGSFGRIAELVRKPRNETAVETHLRLVSECHFHILSAGVVPNAGQGARSASGVDPSGSGYSESVADIGTTRPDQPDDYQVAFEVTPDGVVVSIGGELDVASAGNVRDRLVEAIEDYPPNVRLDLAGLRFIDSSAVGLLVAMKQSVNDYGGHFSMRCSPEGHLALGRHGLLDYLDVDSA